MRRLIIVIIIVIVLLFFVFQLFFSKGKETNQEVVSVSVTPVLQKNITAAARTIGNVEAYASVEIRSMITAPLVKIEFKEGDLVKQDAVLFVLDQRPLIAAVNQAQANFFRDQAVFNKDSAALERNRKLLKSGYVSKQDFDNLIANAKSSEAMVKADQAALDNAQIQLDYATIKAPISGKTGNINFKLGSVIKANDTLPLVTINQIHPIYVTFNLPQSKLNQLQDYLKKNQRIIITAVLENNRSESGSLVFIDNSIDITTGSIKLKAQFTNDKNLLWPGQYVTVEIPLINISNALLIPNIALLTGQKGFYVYVVDTQSQVHQREVIPGENINDLVVIQKGLNFGEQVVTAGQLKLREGMKVSIK